MHSFHYRDGHLYCEDVDLTRVATEFGTPTYVYSARTILDHYTRLDAALAPLDHLICYAVKANSNRAILNLFVRAGAGLRHRFRWRVVSCARGGRRSGQMHIRRRGQIP